VEESGGEGSKGRSEAEEMAAGGPWAGADLLWRVGRRSLVEERASMVLGAGRRSLVKKGFRDYCHPLAS
jgi:hypothetical protein